MQIQIRRNLTKLLAATTVLLLAANGAGCASTGGNSGAKRLLVAGATGGTGQEAVKQAIAKGYKVRVLVRDESKARALFGDSVEYVIGNVREPATLAPAVKNVDYVISALGSNSRRDPENKPEAIDFRGVEALANAAKAARVKQLVLVSSMGVTHPDHPLNKMLDNIMTWKLRGEDALRASGVPYTVVRPGGLRDAPGGAMAVRALQGDPMDVTGQIARADVAAVCVNALGRADAVNKTFEVLSGPAGAATDWTALFSSLKPDVK